MTSQAPSTPNPRRPPMSGANDTATTRLPAATTRLPAARRRRQLADIALETFSRRGYDATVMDDIAEAAGVTKPVLYQHFASKQALYLELLDDVGSQLLESITKAAARADGPRQRVVAGFTAYFRFVTDHESAYRLLFGSGAPRDGQFGRHARRVEEEIADTIASLIDADIDLAHRRLLANAVVGMAEGAVRYWLRFTGEKPDQDDGYSDAIQLPSDPERLARRIADVAWAGLRAVRRD